MFIIVSGSVSVRLRKGSSTGYRKLDSLGPGNVFGEMSLLTGEVRTASVVADEETEVIEVGKEAIRPVFHSSPDLLTSIGEMIEERRPALEQTMHESMPDRKKGESKPIISALKRFFGLDQ
jgi:CRP-like cAMP-binding protein